MKNCNVYATEVVANLLKDKVELNKKLQYKDSIIEELTRKISVYERRLSTCQKTN